MKESIGRLPEVWIPMMMQSQVMPGRAYLNADDVKWLHMMARIKPGVVEEQVRANLNVILRQYLSEIAGKTKDARQQQEILNQRIEPTPGSKGISDLRQEFSQPLLVLMAVVGLVLLITCANVANLLLARATVRHKEIAVRLVIGAGRLRLVRQLFIESVSLAALGGSVALLLAYWGTDLLLALMSNAGIPVRLDLHPDVRIFGFTGAVSLSASFVFGLAPAFLATRVDLAPALKENPGTIGGSGLGSRLGRVLVIAQVAASLLMLIGAGLFIRSLQKLGNLDAGFDRESVLVLGIDPEASGYDNTQLGSLYQRLQERATTLPGVHSAALSDNGLFDGSTWTSCCVSVEEQPPAQDEGRAVRADLVTPGFFATVGMPLLQGRDFGPQDNESTTKVGVINETLSRYYFPDESPIGKRFSLGDSQESRTIEIVGVVKDAKYNSLREQTPRFLYLPYSQNAYGLLHFLAIRTLGDPGRMINIARRELQTVDKRLRITQVKTLTQQVDETLAQERLIAASSSIFGLLSLLLASIGLYGLMSYTVSRRVREVGIRMALGAERGDVLRLIVGQGMILTLMGAGIGLAGAFALTRVLTSLLYGVTATDPATFIGISLLLTGVALLACYIPARRPAKVDPMVALRYE
ncbi:MAG: multidrug ABC transporter substrate-binding protein [Acidobacteria bacterium]|nr:MAG: multidrug ABC transporter substrate-binding protein [Acidobacteriota bacterium]